MRNYVTLSERLKISWVGFGLGLSWADSGYGSVSATLWVKLDSYQDSIYSTVQLRGLRDHNTGVYLRILFRLLLGVNLTHGLRGEGAKGRRAKVVGDCADSTATKLAGWPAQSPLFHRLLHFAGTGRGADDGG